MGMGGGFVAPPPPNMVPQGMYPVTMGGQQPQPPRNSPYPQQPPPAGPYPPQGSSQSPYPTQAPPMASSQPAPPPPARSCINPDTMPLSQIDTLPDAEVMELLENSEKFNAFVMRLPCIQDYMLRADKVKSLEAEVNSLSARSGNPAIDAKRQELEMKRAEFRQKSEMKQRKEGELSQNALYEKLDAAAKVTDGECDEIASRFLSGDMSAQDFAKAYKEKRLLFHTRSAKKEAILHNGM